MPQWEKVVIVGVGLIGGSIGLALRRRELAGKVVGVGRRAASLEAALAAGCITSATTDLAAGVAGADLVVVCTPVDQIAPLVIKAGFHVPTRCLLTDAGSTKEAIVRTVEAALVAGRDRPADRGPRFVGSHPLAGSEKSGPEAASAELFEGRLVILTPTEQTDPEAIQKIAEFWQSLGARVVTMSPAEHDAALARTSHLPHLIASALAAATPAELLPLTAGGWQDATRIAAGDVALWREIFLANRAATLKALADFETVLAQFREALQAADADRLAALLAEGKRRRDAVGS